MCELSTAGLCPSARKDFSPKKRKTVIKDLSEPEVEIAVETKAELPTIENGTGLQIAEVTEE